MGMAAARICFCFLLASLLICSARTSFSLSDNEETRLELDGRRLLKVNLNDYSDPTANRVHDPLPPGKNGFSGGRKG